VAKSIVDHVFLQWGMCHEILTDLGKEFEAELLSELLQQFGITHLRSSGYRPQTNGVCEVWYRTLNSVLAKVIPENQRDWPDLVPYVVVCYNATEHSATGFCPFFIFTGRQPLWNVDLLLPETQAEESTLPDYAVQVTEQLAVASLIVRENLKNAAETASKWYNKKSKPRTFSEGSHVSARSAWPFPTSPSDVTFMILTHHHILLEMRDGREEFRRLPPDEAAHRCQVVRGRRRGRQCRAQAEAACRPPSPAAKAATRHPSPDNCSTNYLSAGYLSDTSSDEFEFETSQPEGMESMPELSFVGRICVGGPVGAASPAADSDAVGGQTSPVRQHGV